MKYIIILLTLSGCCSLQYPLDGKAQSACERSKKAAKLCADNGGVKQATYDVAYCKDGAEMEYTK